MFQFSYYHVLLVFWTITLSLVDHSATGQRTCLRSDKVPEAKSMPTTTRFTDIGPAVFSPADVQCKVRTSPNCLFPQWDKKLKQWDEDACMERPTGGGCIGVTTTTDLMTYTDGDDIVIIMEMGRLSMYGNKV